MHKIISSQKRRQRQSHPGQSGSIDRSTSSPPPPPRRRRHRATVVIGGALCTAYTLPGNRPPPRLNLTSSFVSSIPYAVPSVFPIHTLIACSRPSPWTHHTESSTEKLLDRHSKLCVLQRYCVHV